MSDGEPKLVKALGKGENGARGRDGKGEGGRQGREGGKEGKGEGESEKGGDPK